MVRQEACDGIRLEGWHREEVAEASSTKDNLLACAFWVIHSISRVDLCRTDSCDEWTCNRETRVEASAACRFLAYSVCDQL